MRKAGLTLALFFAGCGGGVFSPDDPKEFDRSMFDASHLDALPKEERPFVMGHAIGVYLYGKTLPGYTHGHYIYRPGKSAPHARYAYEWSGLMDATSGGLDGDGGGLRGDDVSIPDPLDPDDGDNEPGPSSGPGSPGEDDVEPGDDPDGGDGGGGGGDGDCGEIHISCDTFLGAAATDAREMAREVIPAQFRGADEIANFDEQFELGMWTALVEIEQDLTNEGEVGYVKENALEIGLCRF